MLIGSLLAGAVPGAIAPASASTGGDPRTVRVGVYDNAPKVYRDDAGEANGMFVALVRAIAADEGWRLEFVHCQWQACLEGLERGTLDLMPDVAYTQARDRRFAFHDIPVAHSWSVVLAPGGPDAIESLVDLGGLRVALLAGSVQTGELERVLSGLGIEYTATGYPSYADAFAAVRGGQADAAVANSFYASRFAAEYGLRQTPAVFNPATLYFAVPEGDPRSLLPVIDRYLERWRHDRGSIYYDALQSAMLPAHDPVVPPGLRNLLVASVGLALLLLMTAVVFRWQVRRATGELRETTRRLDHLLEASPAVLYQLTLDGGRPRTRWVSDNIRRLFGFDPGAFVDEDRWPRQLHPEDREAVLNNLGAIADRGHLVQEYRILDADGRERSVRDEMQLVPGGSGQADEIVGAWNDETESREQAARLRFLTHYDPLTRLPNRALLRERLVDAINRARREDRVVAVLFVDLDRFTSINASLGRGTGDAVLRGVAERLEAVIRRGDALGRIGGDGFVVLMPQDAGPHRAVALAREIVERFDEPVTAGGRSVPLTLSIGISLCPGEAHDADTALQHAEAAMHEARRSGRSAWHVYASADTAGIADRLALEGDLRGAAARGELLLHYQPQVELASHRVAGMEALVRWQRPGKGLVPPGEFIPLAEELGLIGEIGAWALREACRRTVELRAAGVDVPRVAVNLSVQQLDPETLVPLVAQILAQTGLEPGGLELEITESMIMREPEQSAAVLRALRDRGIGVAIDDFGTGYSSLSYLRALPIERLKIDRSFVQAIGRDASGESINRAIIGLARSLGLDTVAEGVEQEEQARFLCAEGCRVGQGYLYGAPVPGERLAELMDRLAAG